MVQKLYTPRGACRETITLLDTGNSLNSDGTRPALSIWKKGLKAKVELLQGRELLKAQEIVQEVTHRIVIPYYIPNVLSRMYVQLHDGRLLGIQAVQIPDYPKNMELHLLCVERS